MLIRMKKENEKLAGSLISFGFSKRETEVYIAILELGRATVSQISRKAGINRTTGYDILDSLASKGLASISGKEPKQEYVAESPDALLSYLKKQLGDVQESIVKAHDIIPQLKSVHKVGDRPQVKFYEGLDGIRTVFEDSLAAQSGKIIAFTSIEDQHALIPNYFPEYYQRRKHNKIFMRAIFPDTPMGIERQGADPNEYRDSVLVPEALYGIHPAINVYDNTTMIASFRERLGILVESAEIADAMKKMFELAWIGAHALEKYPELGAQATTASM